MAKAKEQQMNAKERRERELAQMSAKRAKRAEPNERLDRYLSAFALALRAFADSRDWDQYHTPRNLAIAIFSEAGELASEFRWTESPDVAHVQEELADVFIFTCMLADRMGINLAQAARDKVAKNAEKYPPASVDDWVDEPAGIEGYRKGSYRASHAVRKK